MIPFLLTLLVTLSNADDFSQHTVPVSAISCKELDYDSYFVAQNSKTSIRESNPEVSKPNFAGRYLILKNQLMMENVWMIADCATGKFIKEKLSGATLEFKADSALVVLKSERSPEEYYVWSEENWNRVEVVPAVAATSSVPAQNKKNGSATTAPAMTPSKKFETAAVVMQQSTLEQYAKIYQKTATTVSTSACKAIDFNSYFKAQQAKTNILSFKPDLTRPNFAGRYLLLKNEVLFETLWLIADCETGKFFAATLNGKAIFKPESALAVIRQSGDFSQLMVWSDQHWIQIADLSRPNHPPVKTTLEGEKALILYNAFPNPAHDKVIRFESVSCVEKMCSADLFKNPKVAMKAESNRALSDLLDLLGGPLEKGSCEGQTKFPSCEITIR